MSDTSTKRVEELARYHELSAKHYAESPEGSARSLAHLASAELIRALAAERNALRAALEEKE